jgi:hypothetical protein
MRYIHTTLCNLNLVLAQNNQTWQRFREEHPNEFPFQNNKNRFPYMDSASVFESNFGGCGTGKERGRVTDHLYSPRWVCMSNRVRG